MEFQKKKTGKSGKGQGISEKSWKVKEKSGNFRKENWKVREKSGNLASCLNIKNLPLLKFNLMI